MAMGFAAQTKNRQLAAVTHKLRNPNKHPATIQLTIVKWIVAAGRGGIS
jgi:hypothetical protein